MMKPELYTPESYKNASSYEKDRVCNGCGPKGIGSVVIPNSIWGVNITQACNVHDWMYDRGCTIQDKEQADRVFLNNMIRLIGHSSFRWLTRLRQMSARNYYRAVRDFGGPYFWA